MARSAEGLPTKPRGKVKPKRKAKRKTTHVRKQNGQGAPKGNEFWRFAMENIGRDKEYTPELLAAKAIEYFLWVEANPLTKDIGGGKTQDLGRPLTIGAFCLFAGITHRTFNNYAEGIGYKEFFPICEQIKETIRTQKYEGAAVGKFNAAIIARDLGLVDRQERDIGNKGGQPFQTENKTLTAEITPDMDEKQASQLYRALLNPPKEQA